MCNICEKGHFALKIKSQCSTTFTEVSNCKTYNMESSTSPTAKCTECMDEFVLDSGSCKAISNNPGCITKDSLAATNCSKCKKGLGLNTK